MIELYEYEKIIAFYDIGLLLYLHFCTKCGYRSGT